MSIDKVAYVAAPDLNQRFPNVCLTSSIRFRRAAFAPSLPVGETRYIVNAAGVRTIPVKFRQFPPLLPMGLFWMIGWALRSPVKPNAADAV